LTITEYTLISRRAYQGYQTTGVLKRMPSARGQLRGALEDHLSLNDDDSTGKPLTIADKIDTTTLYLIPLKSQKIVPRDKSLGIEGEVGQNVVVVVVVNQEIGTTDAMNEVVVVIGGEIKIQGGGAEAHHVIVNGIAITIKEGEDIETWNPENLRPSGSWRSKRKV